MNKVIASMLIIIVIISAVIFGTAIYKKSIANNENIESKKNTKVADEEIVDDECTQEWENLNETSKEELLQANSSEEKISPNCKVVLKEKYLKCNDETENKIQIPQELINKTKDDVEKYYTGWKIEKFSDQEISLYKEYDLECGEHYVLRDENGLIAVYKKSKSGAEFEYKVTDISTQYLPETDKINLKNGYEVKGEEELNKVLEDFE